MAREPREESLEMALRASGTTAQTKSFELVRVRVHPHWYPTGKTSLESVRVRVRTSTSSVRLVELELGFAYEFSARIELEIELLTQLRPCWLGKTTPRSSVFFIKFTSRPTGNWS